MVVIQKWSFLLNGIEVVGSVLEKSKIYRTKKSTEADVVNIIFNPNIINLITPQNGQSIVISRGDATAYEEYIFRGVVERVDNETSNWMVDCVSEYTKLKTLLVTKSWNKNIDPEAGQVSAIASTIFTDGGFTSSVVATGVAAGDVVLDKFISSRKERSNRLDVLAGLVGYLTSYDYQNAQALFEPIGTTAISTILTVGSNVYNIPRWQEASASVRNVIYVDGAFLEDSGYSNTFTGDASTTVFSLTSDFTIASVKVVVDGVTQVMGIAESSETFDYSLDKDLKKITFESGSVPSATADNIVVDFTVKVPYTSVASDQSSIDLYNGGIPKEVSFTFKDIISVNDADARAEGILEKLKDAKLRTKLLTNVRNISPGNTVSVVDIKNSQYNGDYIVQSIRTNFPNPIDEVEIGEAEFNRNDFVTNVNDRLANLEGDNDLINEILRQIKQFTTTIKVRTRSLLKESRDISGSDTLYWKSDTNGTWNDFKWGNGSDVAWVADVLIPGNNKFEEYVLDTDYYDSGNSVGVTWDTSNQDITISDVLYSNVIAKGPTYIYATVTLGSATGTYTVEISADNKSTWQTVTVTNRTLLSSSDGTGVFVRVTNTASGGGGWPTPFGSWGIVTSPVVIANTYTTQNVYDLPAVNIFLEE